MSGVIAKPLIKSKYANVPDVSSNPTREYLTPASTRTTIDKFTATNVSGGSQTITIYLVNSGDVFGGQNQIIQAKSITAGATYDFTELKGHILEAGDSIWVVTGGTTPSLINMRAAGREVT